MLFLIVGLHYEYHSFVDQLRQAMALKYNQSAPDCDEPWYENDFSEDSSGNDVADNSFCVVNRDSDYLKESSQDFAKKHCVAYADEELYDPQLVWAKNEQRISPKKRRLLPKRAFLRRVFSNSGILQCPIDLASFWMSSRFGPRRKSDGSSGFHYGIDMAAPKGTTVKAAGLGTVVEAGMNNGFGKTIVIKHADGIYRTRYAHLDQIFVSLGQRVSMGQKIGAVGNTGFVRGENGRRNAYHLHFEVKQRGKHIDPLKVITS